MDLLIENQCKCLGLTVAGSLGWGQHVSEVACRATGALGFLWRSLALAPGRAGEVACRALVRPQLEYAAPIWHPYHETQTEKVERVQKAAAGWACGGWGGGSGGVGGVLGGLGWPSLRSRGERSSLAFFCKIHSGAVSLGRDKYLTPAPNLRRTRASHELQYTRQFAYGDALKDSFSPELFRFGSPFFSGLIWGRWGVWGFISEACVLVCLYLYLVNSFNGPPQMFFSPLTKF